MSLSRHLLWFDCTAAATAGLVVLAFSDWLSRLHALPQTLLIFIAAVNLLYAAYAFTLARRTVRPMALVLLLVCANLVWALVCLTLAARFLGQASLFGIAHLAGEAVFTGGLAVMEWKQRDQLETSPGTRNA